MNSSRQQGMYQYSTNCDTGIKCLINIRGQIQYKQHLESCDKHYCHLYNKRFHSNQTCQKHLKKTVLLRDLLVRIVQ